MSKSPLCFEFTAPANDVSAEKIPDHLLEKYFELLTDVYRCLSCLNQRIASSETSRLDILLPSVTVAEAAKPCSASSDVIITQGGVSG